jgi:hypothetical protein
MKDLSPKNQMIINILQQEKDIIEALKKPDTKKTMYLIALLINRLEVPENEKEIIKLKNKFSLLKYNDATFEDAEKAYFLVHDFLTKTYYSGFKNKGDKI